MSTPSSPQPTRPATTSRRPTSPRPSPSESSAGLHPGAPQAAHTALAAAHAAYESRFGHAFVISLDGSRPEEYLDQVLAGIRARLGHERDEERAVSAEQLRGLARSRLAHVVANHPESDVAGASR